ncbi:MAG TPA: polysaccharide deacetylase family protein [Polyangiaceae bacterium]|nr:polysaccharide deacetylase family protein [Polyangiaceae bacterium]
MLRALDGLGLVGGLLRLRRVVSLPWLTSFCYHRTMEPTLAHGGDSGTVDATPAQFDEQVSIITDHFRLVSLDELVAHIERGAKLPPNPALLTFDDGYKECLTTSLPVLARRGARAAFFIPTDFVTERRMFWWDRIARIVKRSTASEIAIDYPFRLVLAKNDAVAALLAIVKRTRALDLPRFLEELERAAGVTIERDEERRFVDDTLLTWDEVKALSDAGMDVGSHTRTHRVLATLTPDAFEEELRGSRVELEERLDRPIKTIAYPVGYPLDTHSPLREAVRDAGYAIGFTCRAGAMRTNGATDPLDVPRLLMDVGYGRQDFAAMASVPALAPRTSIDIA